MLWQQRDPEIVIKEILIPVYTTDNRSYEDKWNDVEYLKEVNGLFYNNVFVAEMIKALSDLRHIADTANTPDKLAGCQEGIKILKNVLLLPEKAKRALQLKKEMEEVKKNEVDYSAR